MEERLARRKRLIQGEEQMEIVPSGEEGVQQIKALVGLDRMGSNVNMPNSFLQIPNLPKEAVVETNAVFSRDSIAPVYAGNLYFHMYRITDTYWRQQIHMTGIWW